MWWLLVLLLSAFDTSGMLEQRAQHVEPQPIEVRSELKVIGVYGQRADTTSDLNLVLVNVELSAGSRPADLMALIVRYSDGTQTSNYAWGDEHVDPRADERPAHFSAYWIRGDGAAGVMEPGDLVEIRFMPPADIPERTDVAIDLIPETGDVSSADFRTPPTYSSDTTITLR